MQSASDEALQEVPGVTPAVLSGLRQLFSELEGEVVEGEPTDVVDATAGSSDDADDPGETDSVESQGDSAEEALHAD